MWERLDLPLKVLGAATAIVVPIVTVLIAVFGNPFAPDPISAEARKTPQAVAAYAINKCMRAHDLGASRQRVERRVIEKRDRHYDWRWKISFKRCDWPPLSPTSTDGYSEVLDDAGWIKGQGGVDQFAIMNQIQAGCDQLLLTFVIAQTGGRVFGTVRLLQGRLLGAWAAWDGHRQTVATRLLPWIPGSLTFFPPYNMDLRFNVLQSGHTELYDARCRR